MKQMTWMDAAAAAAVAVAQAAGTTRMLAVARCASPAADDDEGVSLRPSDAVKGGSVIDDLDVEVVSAEVALYDFPRANGQTSPAKVCVVVGMQTEAGDVHQEYLAAADPKFFMPNSEGTRIVSISEKGGLIENTRFMLFLTSLVNHGFPEDRIKRDVRFLVGLKAHIKRKPAPASWGTIEKREGQREPTVLEVTQIHQLPGEVVAKKAGAGRVTQAAASAPAGRVTQAPARAAAGAASAPAAAGKPNGAAASGDLDETLTALVQAAVKGTNGLSKKDLLNYVFANAPQADKKALTKRVSAEDFLEFGDASGAFSYADGVIGEAAAG